MQKETKGNLPLFSRKRYSLNVGSEVRGGGVGGEGWQRRRLNEIKGKITVKMLVG